jgi:hypothetical protein
MLTFIRHYQVSTATIAMSAEELYALDMCGPFNGRRRGRIEETASKMQHPPLWRGAK